MSPHKIDLNKKDISDQTKEKTEISKQMKTNSINSKGSSEGRIKLSRDTSIDVPSISGGVKIEKVFK